MYDTKLGRKKYDDDKDYHPISKEIWKKNERGHFLKLTSEPNLINIAGEVFTFTPQFNFGHRSLINGKNIKVNIVKAPEGLTIDANNRMSFTPLTSGEFEVIFTATMGKATKEFSIKFQVYEKDPIIAKERISSNGGSFTLKFKGTSYDNALITIPRGAFSQSTEISATLLRGARPDPEYKAIVPTTDPLLAFDPPLPSGSTIELSSSALKFIPKGFSPNNFVMSAWTNATNRLSPLSILDQIVLMATMELGYQFKIIINDSIEYYGPAYTKYEIQDHGNFRLIYLLGNETVAGRTQIETVDPLIVKRIFSTLDLSLAKSIELGCGDIPKSRLVHYPPFIVYGKSFTSDRAKIAAGSAFGNIIYLQNDPLVLTFSLEENLAHEFFHIIQFYLTSKPFPRNENLFQLIWWIESTAQDFMNSVFPNNNYITVINSNGWDESLLKYGIGNTSNITEREVNYDLITWISYLKLHTKNPNFVCEQYKTYGDDIEIGQIYDGLDLVGSKTLGEKYLEFADTYSVTRDESKIADIGLINPTINYHMLNYPSPQWETEGGWNVKDLIGALSYKLSLKISACEQKRLVIKDMTPKNSEWLAVVRDSGLNVLPPTDCSVNKSCYISDLSKPDDLPLLKGGDEYTITMANTKFPASAIATNVQPPMNIHISLKDAPRVDSPECTQQPSPTPSSTPTPTPTIGACIARLHCGFGYCPAGYCDGGNGVCADSSGTAFDWSSPATNWSAACQWYNPATDVFDH
jgi:hypothetical protein